MQLTPYPDFENPASPSSPPRLVSRLLTLRDRALELRIRQEAVRHGLSPQELPDLLELLAARQRRRLERTEARLQARRAA